MTLRRARQRLGRIELADARAGFEQAMEQTRRGLTDGTRATRVWWSHAWQRLGTIETAQLAHELDRAKRHFVESKAVADASGCFSQSPLMMGSASQPR